MEIEEEKDEIEKEIDIVYSGEFSNGANIFQFPLIPKNSMNIQNINSLSISQDKTSMKMEMNLDEKYLDKNNYNAIPIQTLKGEKIENNTNLCLGIIKNNKLYLTPLSQVFQFRHDFSDLNKDKSLKLKKDKRESKSFSLKNIEKDEDKYIPLTVHQPESINSKIILEKMASSEGQIKKANYMTKNEYFDLLLKYVITEDSGGDTNDDLFLKKNGFSKEEFSDNEDDNMDIEPESEKEKDNKKNKKGKGIHSILESIKSGNSDKKSNKADNGFIKNLINQSFENNECLYFDNLLNNICKKMNISKKNEEKMNQIKKEIEENCLIVKENICFIKDIDDNDINEVRNLIIQEIGNNENGLKKQQIKKLIEQNELTITDSKLTKLLQKICKYSGNTWIIKPPVN